ncbi:PREDICTED: BAG family molecular chaperone regulator 4 [Tarenaya hassleriana]|uniref:BAG family molecular chaperone regulator 4 n=1 Tax=Tarenaya hassleriana TaxID=28532 RepID=UPI00053C7D01|nr:PREDICTED: BAG family molecular chaperone regulator 4 [Tarenaya hassleriana]
MMHNSNDDSEFDVRPIGMLVQRRDEGGSDNLHQHPDNASEGFGPAIRIGVSHGSSQHELQVSANATFGDLKKALAQKTGLEPSEQKILFRGHEKEDTEQLHAAGVKDSSKVVLLEDPKKREEWVEKQPEVTEEVAKAIAAITAVRAEVDKLSERVVALEAAVNGGTKVATEEFDMSAELLMRQLLKLDSIEAEGEARAQRKAEVRRVQKFHEIIDGLKVKNANPFIDKSKAAAVTTEWETFENGVGSLNPPPTATTTSKVTQDWEKFD